ncbi:MAG: methyltransferase domain-containing protein [Candidatus Omnitrophica bacterium]|nr:methyltransferase domain-containing protein [Candidatus Omnitrophota bacterium]
MEYKPDLTKEDILKNRILFEERNSFYMDRGLDFQKSRRFILEKAGDPDGNILDIASGKGIMALALARAGYDLTTLDRDEEMLRLTALNLAGEGLLDRVRLFIMDAGRLDFEDASFNCVFMVDALHHMEEIEKVFSEIDRVLEKGGKLVLADFNEKGMDIVERAHHAEGREHENKSLGEEDALRWLAAKGYAVESWQADCHWVVVARKK